MLQDGEIADTVTPDAEAREKALREAAMQSRIKRPAGAGAKKPAGGAEAGEDRGKASGVKDPNWDEKLKRRAERFGPSDSLSPVKCDTSRKDANNGATEGGIRVQMEATKKDQTFGVIPHQVRGSEQGGAKDGALKKSTNGGADNGRAINSVKSDADRTARNPAKPNPSWRGGGSEEGGRGDISPSLLFE